MSYAFEKLAFDAPTVRDKDKNGFLHVGISHLTKAQVAPYRGHEIPGYLTLGLDPNKVYRGYRSPEELSKPETIRSVNGIPIQIEHHPDFAQKPAKETRAGSTGTDGEWKDPYLNNSLHIQDQRAIDLIESGVMRELSLAYRYKPDFSPGKTPEGEDYDFVMRDINANHVALVEEGRAGRDVLVMDESLKDNPMDDINKKVCGDDDPAIEQKEVSLAQQVISIAQKLIDLHKTDENGDVVDINGDDQDGEPSMLSQIAEVLTSEGISQEDADNAAPVIMNLIAPKPQPKTAEDDDDDDSDDLDDGDGDDETNPDPQSIEEDDDLDGEKKDDLVVTQEVIDNALRALDFDGESEEFKRAFAEGLKYGDKVLDNEPKQDPDQVTKVEEKEKFETMSQDAALKRLEKRVEAKWQAKMKAIEDVKPSLGNVKVNAFDSAGDVYLAALKQEGFEVKGVKSSEARKVYQALMLGKSSAQKAAMAEDSKMKEANPSVIGKILGNIRKE